MCFVLHQGWWSHRELTLWPPDGFKAQRNPWDGMVIMWQKSVKSSTWHDTHLRFWVPKGFLETILGRSFFWDRDDRGWGDNQNCKLLCKQELKQVSLGWAGLNKNPQFMLVIKRGHPTWFFMMCILYVYDCDQLPVLWPLETPLEFYIAAYDFNQDLNPGGYLPSEADKDQFRARIDDEYMVCLSDFDLQKPRTGSISGPFLGWHDFNIFFLCLFSQVGVEVNMIVDNLPVACSVAAGSGPCVAEHKIELLSLRLRPSTSAEVMETITCAHYKLDVTGLSRKIFGGTTHRLDLDKQTMKFWPRKVLILFRSVVWNLSPSSFNHIRVHPQAVKRFHLLRSWKQIHRRCPNRWSHKGLKIVLWIVEIS